MKKPIRVTLCQALLLSLPLICAPALLAQTLLVTPSKVTMLVGESRSFRLVDENGAAKHNVAWTVSDPSSFQVNNGDELTIRAQKEGDFEITGQIDGDSAEADVTVMEGNALPTGTAKWSSGDVPGCTSEKVTPAVPSASGVDVYLQSACPDGEYLSAFTADGFMVWRRKIGSATTSSQAFNRNAQMSAQGGRDPSTSAQKPRWTSVCDALSLGTNQEAVRRLLQQYAVSFTEDPSNERVWNVDEKNSQCRLLFGQDSVLAKKTKIYVAQ